MTKKIITEIPKRLLKKIQTGGESTLLIKIHNVFKSILNNEKVSKHKSLNTDKDESLNNDEKNYYVNQLEQKMKPISTKGNFFKFGFDRFKNITLLGNYFDIIIYKKCTHDKKDYYLSTTKMDRIFFK